jgi:hypothetical protein
MPEKSSKVDVSFTVKCSDGTSIAKCKDGDSNILFAHSLDPDCKNTAGMLDFSKRSDIVNALVTGTFIVKVQMRLTNPTSNCLPFIAGNPLLTKVRNLFLDDESTDVVFEVKGGNEQPKTLYSAH